ncbi:divergent polysaccharide deacetylase family protein [Acetivibrio straminisolvens]|uniref:Periplasmic protein n=1 Tax=Acetivibrio straminisolvens JCM 21531 TaxID=1294263 RepID=W4VCG0_9FIRM|nr:divergent polysaccharide deacetylase family protein [Acetivibrio straminisolvens]GAE90468.1 periplasmic protein [Acetivibrio straminisolvens JCM 21531]
MQDAFNDIPCYERNIFLDGQKPKEHVIKKLREAANIAEKNGFAVAIGYVGTEGGKVTAEAIQEMLPEFDERNIQLVFISELDE